MKIKFDAHQQYQLDAVEAVAALFAGQPPAGASSFALSAPAGEMFGELGLANDLLLSHDGLLTNARAVQQANGIEPSSSLALLEDVNSETGERVSFPNFSVEMETGTGKTYVYLRTVYELNRRYGFRKFIVVVPSVAIREGVLQNITLTRDHFAALYDNIPLDAWVYDAAQVSKLREFATSSTMQLLIINIDAFNKAANVMNKDQDRLSGRRPIEFIRAASPIVIMDEPQNMESTTSRAAIASLGPLLTLRYSATHRHVYNLIYRLDPVRAYDLRLVKRIEVDSVLEANPDFNRPYIRVLLITPTKSAVAAKIEIDAQGASAPVRKSVNVRASGADLHDLSGGRDLYRGYIVDEINAASGYVRFTNGVRIGSGQAQGGNTDAIMRVQIDETVKEHFEKELAISRRPPAEQMKVLSLFFIDRVDNYRRDDGKIRRWFVEAYEKYRARSEYAGLNPLPVDGVHNGYFSGGRDRDKWKDSSEDRSTRADDEAYTLIMKDKQRLLSREEPLRFIFSHSALREGWDNPNVFQICTLNETRSEMKKRQEIGRGLRLPVRADGERSSDDDLARLTVIANQSYHDFATALQKEIEEETGVTFKDRTRNARHRRTANLKKGWRADPEFLALWGRIKHKTRFNVQFSTADLINRAATALRDEMPAIERPKLSVQRTGIRTMEGGLEGTMLAARSVAAPGDGALPVPDLLAYLQRETELTRATLAEILVRSGRLADVALNPQAFLDSALAHIRHELHELIVSGIKYERIEGDEYEMLLFEEKDIAGYMERMMMVDKSIYDAIEYESPVERAFAEALDVRDDIKLFLKLPRWFTVDTPLGTYNPDWAIVKREGHDERLYLVRETKGTDRFLDLREVERAKIRCGTAHFAALNVDYKWVSSAAQV